MKGRFACLVAVAVVFSSCDENKEVVVTETRPTSTRDRSPKLFASSDERFRNAKSSPVKADTPDGWLALPSTQFRLLNYRFGESGLGEVWVSISAGSVLENVNRWLGQFDGHMLDQAGLDALRDVPIAGGSGKWVEAEGEYASGMGDPPRPGYALAGVVASINGDILTVKMIGPKEEVLAAREALEKFSTILTLAD
jgi:hypothetical protein